MTSSAWTNANAFSMAGGTLTLGGNLTETGAFSGFGGYPQGVLYVQVDGHTVQGNRISKPGQTAAQIGVIPIGSLQLPSH